MLADLKGVDGGVTEAFELGRVGIEHHDVGGARPLEEISNKFARDRNSASILLISLAGSWK